MSTPIQEKLKNPEIFKKAMDVLEVNTEPIQGEDFSYNLNWNGKEFEKGDYPESVKKTSDKLKNLMVKTDFQGKVVIKGKINDTSLSLSEMDFETPTIPQTGKEDLIKENEELNKRMKYNRQRLRELAQKEAGEKMEKEIIEKIKKVYEKKLNEEKQKMAVQIKKIKKAIKKTIIDDSN